MNTGSMDFAAHVTFQNWLEDHPVAILLGLPS